MPVRFKFTKTAVAALKAPGEGRSTFYDSEVPRMALRVTAAGAKVFYVIKRDGAKVGWTRIGAFPDVTIEQAQREATKVLGQYADGKDPVAAKRAAKALQTLQEAFDAYVRLYAVPHGLKGTEDLRAIWDRCVGSMPVAAVKKHGRPRVKHPAGVDWSGRKLDTVSNAEVRSLHAAIGATHPTMANRVVELISTVYNRAIEWGYTGTNPTLVIKPFKEAKRDRFIQSDELPKFFEALAADSSTDFQHFVLLALLTGARRMNVLSARWEDVSIDRAVWRIPNTKNGDPVTVPLVDQVIAILKMREPKASGFIFPAAAKSGHVSPPKKRWQALIARAGIDGLRIHDLRRSLGSWQAITGASLTIIGKSLGHKSADATMIYARLSMDPVRASVNTATSAMLEAAGLKKPAKIEPIRRRNRAV